MVVIGFFFCGAFGLGAGFFAGFFATFFAAFFGAGFAAFFGAGFAVFLTAFLTAFFTAFLAAFFAGFFFVAIQYVPLLDLSLDERQPILYRNAGVTNQKRASTGSFSPFHPEALEVPVVAAGPALEQIATTGGDVAGGDQFERFAITLLIPQSADDPAQP